MPLPLILGAAAIYGAKKGYDGYQNSSKADEILAEAKEKTDSCRRGIEIRQKSIKQEFKRLKELELTISKNFELLKEIFSNEVYAGDYKDVSIQSIHQIDKVIGEINTFNSGIENSSIVIGGASLAIFGVNILTSPLFVFTTYLYSGRAEKKLRTAEKILQEADSAKYKVEKQLFPRLEEIEEYVIKVYDSLEEMNRVFEKDYLDILRSIMVIKNQGFSFNLNEKERNIIENAINLAVIICDILKTPLFIDGSYFSCEELKVKLPKVNKSEIICKLDDANDRFKQL